LGYRNGLKKEKEVKEKLANEVASQEVPIGEVRCLGKEEGDTSVTPQDLNEYCSLLFHFENFKIAKFKQWRDRRKLAKIRKWKTLKMDIAQQAKVKLEQEEEDKKGSADDGKNPNNKNRRPTLAKETKIISIPVLDVEPTQGAKETPNPLYQRVVKKGKKEWVLNPNRKSSICVLHEYVQHTLKQQPTYKTAEMESSTTPYSCTVIINGIEYGTGIGGSKKEAKGIAATKSLEILIPGFSQGVKESDGSLPDLSVSFLIEY